MLQFLRRSHTPSHKRGLADELGFSIPTAGFLPAAKGYTLNGSIQTQGDGLVGYIEPGNSVVLNAEIAAPGVYRYSKIQRACHK
jgi:hypothetical protein